jgi:hypothetical protein
MYRSAINPEYEREVTRDFKLKARHFLQGKEPQSEIEWLLLMQHHGAPTRILDWTESPLVALYFAVLQFENELAGAVWALNPWILNDLSLGAQTVPTAKAPEVSAYLVDTSDPNIRTPDAELPLALRMEYSFSRVHAQRGAATIHGKSKQGINLIRDHLTKPNQSKSALERARHRFLKKILIAPSEKYQILKSLYQNGMGADTLYPDLDGLAKAINFRYDHRYLEEKDPSP